MHVAIICDAVGACDAPDALDVLVQADAVAGALSALGHSSCKLACTLDLAAVIAALERDKADLVFNLVESIQGQGRLIHLLPFCLDALNMPYTGAPAEAMLLTSGKVLAKRWMNAVGIPTPAWIGPWPGGDGTVNGDSAGADRWIVKSAWEHASIGLDADSIVTIDEPEAITALLRKRAPQLGGACFAERFIAGREFNLSLLAGESGPQVLAPAEILFEGFSGQMPHIVDYGAKWDETTYAFHNTPRRFDFPDTDAHLIDALASLAVSCWHHFQLRGYARVDFRVDAAGRPWVLEINTNPCLSPDAGFAAALQRTDIAFADAVARILADVSPFCAQRKSIV